MQNNIKRQTAIQGKGKIPQIRCASEQMGEAKAKPTQGNAKSDIKNHSKKTHLRNRKIGWETAKPSH